jgi:NAD(P)-dependent dehydrogenase (short-subunit alcohol dehydrogenase family)
MSFNIDLSDKIVVITGVSSGIGAAIAKSYASANAKIAGCALESPEDSNVKCFIENVKNESGIPIYMSRQMLLANQIWRILLKVPLLRN